MASFYNKLWLTAIAWTAKDVYVLLAAIFKDPEPQRLAQASAAERAANKQRLQEMWKVAHLNLRGIGGWSGALLPEFNAGLQKDALAVA
jgi:hypothetical protein